MSECWEYPEIPGQCGAHNRRLFDCRARQERIVHVPPADVTGLNSPRCHVCEYPLDHRCQRCGERACITKGCAGDHALVRHGRGLCGRPTC